MLVKVGLVDGTRALFDSEGETLEDAFSEIFNSDYIFATPVSGATNKELMIFSNKVVYVEE